MISKYKTVSIIYGGSGRRYAELLNESIVRVSDEQRYPICSKLIMETILTKELLSDVIALFKESEFCVAFLTADDIVAADNKKFRLRQNVVFELGMALIQLGRERCILLCDFDYRAADFDLPSDMSSLEMLQFAPDDIERVISELIKKILAESKNSIISGIKAESTPQYKDLLKVSEYYIDYENLFAGRTSDVKRDGSGYFQAILQEWYEECTSLSHYDERCIYLLERLCFLPIFPRVDEVVDFMERVGKSINQYQIWDIKYYKNNNLLNFTRNLVNGVIEYTQIKMNDNEDKNYLFDKVLNNLLSEEVPYEDEVNPLMLLVYYDYLGLAYLKLANNDPQSEYLQNALKAFQKSLTLIDRVDASMQVWSGFLYFNLARSYEIVGDLKNAEKLYRDAIKIRERWLKITSLSVKIKNALSSEYFIARIMYLEMQDRYKMLDKEEIQKEYDKLEMEINAYSDFGNEFDPLTKIRRKLAERKAVSGQS